MKRLVPLFFIVFYFWMNRETESHGPVRLKPGPVAAQSGIVPYRPQSDQRMATNGPSPVMIGRPERGPASVGIQATKETPPLQVYLEIKVGKGFQLIKNVGAVPKAEYRPSLGPLLASDGNLSYYEKDPEDPSIPVAFSQMKNKFYPVSKVFQVKGVTPDVRSDLLQEGYDEYHYIPRLKLLFLETTPETVLKTYQELKARGLAVELEVLREPPKSR